MTESKASLLGGQYRLDSLKVSLPMGEIWEAERDGVRFLTFLSAPGFDTPGAIAEGALATNEDLDMPGVIPWTDGGEEDGRFWLAAPLVGEGSFSEIVTQQDGMTPVEAATIIHQVAVALESTGMPHLWLCGDLVRLSSLDKGRYGAQVYGFGLGHQLPGYQPLDKSAPFVGAPNYMSPEQAEGKETGSASDVYAAGVLLYEGIRTRPPFAPRSDRVSPLTTLKRQIFEKPLALHIRYGKLEHIKAYQALTMTVLAKSVAERPEDAEELATALAELVTSEMDGTLISPSMAETGPKQERSSVPEDGAATEADPEPVEDSPPEPAAEDAEEPAAPQEPEEEAAAPQDAAEEADETTDEETEPSEASEADTQEILRPRSMETRKRRRRVSSRIDHSAHTLILDQSPAESGPTRSDRGVHAEATAPAEGVDEPRVRDDSDATTRLDFPTLTTQSAEDLNESEQIQDGWFMSRGQLLLPEEPVEDHFSHSKHRAPVFWYAAAAAVIGVLIVGHFLGGSSDPVERMGAVRAPRDRETKTNKTSDDIRSVTARRTAEREARARTEQERVRRAMLLAHAQENIPKGEPGAGEAGGDPDGAEAEDPEAEEPEAEEPEAEEPEAEEPEAEEPEAEEHEAVAVSPAVSGAESKRDKLRREREQQRKEARRLAREEKLAARTAAQAEAAERKKTAAAERKAADAAKKKADAAKKKAAGDKKKADAAKKKAAGDKKKANAAKKKADAAKKKAAGDKKKADAAKKKAAGDKKKAPQAGSVDAAGTAKEKARRLVALGIKAYKSGNYDLAAGYFVRARNLDPNNPMAGKYEKKARAKLDGAP